MLSSMQVCTYYKFWSENQQNRKSENETSRQIISQKSQIQKLRKSNKHKILRIIRKSKIRENVDHWFPKNPQKNQTFFLDTILHIGSLQILINRYVVCCHSQIADSIMCCSTLQFFVNLSLSVEYEWHNKQVDPFFSPRK